MRGILPLFGARAWRLSELDEFFCADSKGTYVPGGIEIWGKGVYGTWDGAGWLAGKFELAKRWIYYIRVVKMSLMTNG
jgi:hypothetical protein